MTYILAVHTGIHTGKHTQTYTRAFIHTHIQRRTHMYIAYTQTHTGIYTNIHEGNQRETSTQLYNINTCIHPYIAVGMTYRLAE